MKKKQMLWKTKGMNQDLSVSAFNPEFSFENYNLRLSTNEGNTLLSWVNEKGTKYLNTINGIAIGTAVLNDKLIVFTTDDSNNEHTDRIYVLNSSGVGNALFTGNLNFSTAHKIETLVSYEADHVQKVYWTDGVNQPRVINIAADAITRQIWNSQDGTEVFTLFDFVPAIHDGSISVSKDIDGSGVFAPGVIQYCFTYFNKYGQQSNIVDVSPLHFISPTGRGGKPDEKVSNSFTITMSDIDPAFEYARLYAIQRTSIDNVPFVRMLSDFKIYSDAIVYHNEHINSTEMNTVHLPQYGTDNTKKKIVIDSNNVTVTSASPIASGSEWSTSAWENTSFPDLIVYNTNNPTPEIVLSTPLYELFSCFEVEKETIYYIAYSFSSTALDRIAASVLSNREGTGWTWGLQGDGMPNSRFCVNVNDIAGNYLVYNYTTEKWCITGSLPTVEVEAVPAEFFTYVDDGISGSAVDPTEMLFIGGKEIQVMTMNDKSNTLFMGDITMPHVNMTSLSNYFKENLPTIEFDNGQEGQAGDSEHEATEDFKMLDLGTPSGVYYHKQQLDRSLEEISTFKGGDTYRFGFQLQKKTGEWSEPIWIGDKRNEKYPQFNSSSNKVGLVYAQSELSFSGSNFDFSAYKSIRPVIVYPNMADREVLCQGVLNPTVFNVQDRIDNSPFAQASWYFRPYTGAPTGKPKLMFKSSVEDSILQNGIATYVKYNTGSPAVLNLSTQTCSVDSAFVGKTTDVYVLSAEIADPDTLDTICANGYITADYRGGKTSNIVKDTRAMDNRYSVVKNGPVDFRYLGIISATSGSTTKYFFTSSTPWRNEYGPDINGGSEEEGSLKYRGLSNVSTVATPFKIYKRIDKTQSKLMENFYYLNDASLPDTEPNSYIDFIFRFYDTQNYYEIVFENVAGLVENSLSTAETNNPSPATNIKNASPGTAYRGTAIPFTHYKSLLCSSELGDDAVSAKQVEIQGSYKLFDTPYTDVNEFFRPTKDSTQATEQDTFDVNNDAMPSNTQFFIDQSIVTLNSPDIEFDTNVQTCGKDNYGLRVVGVIPLTANVSAHHITTNSSMLENRHNFNGDYTDYAVWLGESIQYFDSTPLDMRESLFGSGELSINSYLTHHPGISGTGRHLVSEYLWNDVIVVGASDQEDKVVSSLLLHDFLVHPWQRTGSLNNDFRSNDKASSLLKTKKESNLLWSYSNFYVNSVDNASSVSNSIDFQIHLSENAEVFNYRLSAQASGLLGINYFPNIDKILYNKNGYKPSIKDSKYSSVYISEVTSPISMKYKSGSHAVIALKGSDTGNVPILPKIEVGGSTIGEFSNPSGTDIGYTFFWGDSDHSLNFHQGTFASPADETYQANDFLLLGELYKIRNEGYQQNLFGGSSPSALKANNWQIGGKAVDLTVTEDNGQYIADDVSLQWTYGDTYYQRYDCLKTYAYTPEDTNQLVEVLSFMCETHVNLDGRYDRNRGQTDNTLMKPEIFNLLNPVYSQQDNFFSYKQTGNEDVTAATLKYPNQVAFSMGKNSTSDVDAWTHVTMANSIELDGDKGNITKLTRFNDQILAFQDSGVSQILYDENTQISTTAGVPIEIANSGKVQGVRYLSDSVGCSNKWSVVNTPAGVYFTDAHDKAIYLFNGQFSNLSQKGGMESWCKQNGIDSYNGFYDRKNQDVLYVGSGTALAWSEKLGTFTSFYDYGSADYLCSIGSGGLWLKRNPKYVPNASNTTSLWGHQDGEYCNFFNVDKGYSMTLVGNPEPQLDKTFTNLEFRACMEGEGQFVADTISVNGVSQAVKNYNPFLPFDTIQTWNEYQKGVANFGYKHGSGPMKHHLADKSAHLNRKFRIWRCDIPRDNDSEIPHPLDRMRNPWIYIKLEKEASDLVMRDANGEPILDRNNNEQLLPLPKTEIHDVMMSYFV